MKPIYKFWTWYDNIPEPWRFLFMLFVLSLPLHVMSLTHQPLWLLLMIPILGTRMWTVHRELNKTIKNDRQ